MVAIETVMSEIDILASSTGNFNVFTLDHKKKLDNNAVVGNISPFYNTIDLAGPNVLRSMTVDNIELQRNLFFPVGYGVIVLLSCP